MLSESKHIKSKTLKSISYLLKYTLIKYGDLNLQAPNQETYFHNNFLPP